VLRDRIAINLATYADCFEREGVPRAEVRARAERYHTTIVCQNVSYAEGMRGIADGANVAIVDVVALNVRYEILYYQFGQNARADGCTTFAVAPWASANQHLLLGDNWDWLPEVQGVVFHTVEANGLETLSFSEAGIVGGKIGLNTAGLGLAINGLTTTDDDWSRLSKPFHVQCYDMLRLGNLDQAKGVLGRERACSANFLLAQIPDRIVDVEAAPRALRQIEPRHGILVHTNHFLDPAALSVVETGAENYDCSCFRLERLQSLLESNGVVSLADLRRYLRDHAQFPDSVCYHVAHGARRRALRDSHLSDHGPGRAYARADRWLALRERIPGRLPRPEFGLEQDHRSRNGTFRAPADPSVAMTR
jgi:isopenicillin-N N-acyltransferase-like protein